MPPGEYLARLSVGDKVSEASFQILANPLYDVSAEEYAAFDEFMTSAEDELRSMHELTNKLYKHKKRISEINGSLKSDVARHKDMKKTLETIVSSMDTWDKEMVQRKSKAYDDVENFENKFTAEYLFMINATDSELPRVNQPSRDRRKVLEDQWSGLQQRGEDMLINQIPAVNKQLWELGIGAIR